MYPFAEVEVAAAAVGQEVVDGQVAVAEDEVIDFGLCGLLADAVLYEPFFGGAQEAIFVIVGGAAGAR